MIKQKSKCRIDFFVTLMYTMVYGNFGKGGDTMLEFFITEGNKIQSIDDMCDGCWISATNPTETEISRLEHELSVDRDFLRAALDEEETSRVESEDGQTLIVIDYPVMERTEPFEIGGKAGDPENTAKHSKPKRRKIKRKSRHEASEDESFSYYTLPMSIIHTPKNVITVSLGHNPITDDFSRGVVKGIKTQYRTQFIFFLLLRVAGKYLQYLKQIDKLSAYVESTLHKSMKNKELIQLLGLEKSLVYFSTSLKSTATVLEKLQRGRYIKLYEEDQDLLDDVLIEVKQAIEMSGIYSNILSGTMDAFASIISNNLNIVMKMLTIITIVMAVPTMVFSFYGMNTKDLPMPYTWVALVVSAALAILAAIILSKSKFYR
jgi:magnesium transporter